ncbi:MAG: response regulator [Candidatus Eiseniibacteriota bacterium]|jgi:pilus assembly protein CpaE
MNQRPGTAGRNGDGPTGNGAGNALRVVLIDGDPAALAGLRHLVSELDDAMVAGEATDIDDGYREVMKARPDLVIMELGNADVGERALVLAERLGDIYPDTAVFVSSAVQSADVLKRAMRAGVREFLGRPLDSGEVSAAVRKLLRQRAQASSHGRRTGQIVAVFAPKGGSGATFITTNLGVGLCRAAGRTAIVDLNLEMGDVATFLNVRPQSTIVDVVEAGDNLDASLLESALVHHGSGVEVLAEPAAAEDADRIEAQHVGQLLIRMKTLFDYVVVDLSHRFDEHTLEALDLADHILLVSVLELPTIRNTRRCLEVFEKLGYDDERLKLVINRHRASRSSERFEKSFGHPIYWRLPNDYATAISAINAGVPVADVGAESALAASLRGLAVRIDGRGRRGDQRPAAHAGRFRLLRRLLPATGTGG